MASQPSTSSGPTNVERPEAKRMAFQAFAGEMVSVGSDSNAQASSMMTSIIASSPTVDAIS
eukprot:3248219-Heterocapsa_arctica.AAC.1